jgi:hypothetical protein
MKIDSRAYCVPEGTIVELRKWTTREAPVYNSKRQYRKLLESHAE